MSNTSSSNKYCLDTSFFIHAWERYNPEFCLNFWDCVADAIKQGNAFVLDDVFEELLAIHEKPNPEFKHRYINHIWTWLDGLKKHKITPSGSLRRKVANEYNKIERQFIASKDGKRKKGVSETDLLLIYYAESIKAAVVTNEAPQKRIMSSNGNYKIPDYCKHLNIECLGIHTFINKYGWKFETSIESSPLPTT